MWSMRRSNCSKRAIASSSLPLSSWRRTSREEAAACWRNVNACWRARVSVSLLSSSLISRFIRSSVSSTLSTSCCRLTSRSATRCFSIKAARARSSFSLRRASSAFSCHSWHCCVACSMRRSSCFFSASARAEVERTSTSVSSISWIISRTSFCGSSALSNSVLMLAFTISAKREKIPMMLSSVSMTRLAHTAGAVVA